MGSSYVYRTVRVRLADLPAEARLRVWQHRSEQGQAYNLGVELALAAAGKGDGLVAASSTTAWSYPSTRRARQHYVIDTEQ